MESEDSRPRAPDPTGELGERDELIAKQFEAIRRADVTFMLDRHAVAEWARLAGFHELAEWVSGIEIDHYCVWACSVRDEWAGRSIDPLHPDMVRG